MLIINLVLINLITLSFSYNGYNEILDKHKDTFKFTYCGKLAYI